MQINLDQIISVYVVSDKVNTHYDYHGEIKVFGFTLRSPCFTMFGTEVSEADILANGVNVIKDHVVYYNPYIYVTFSNRYENRRIYFNTTDDANAYIAEHFKSINLLKLPEDVL